MIRKHSPGNFDSQTCLCCMCRCGDHKCFQQLALKLPTWMQNELKFDKDKQQTRKGKKASEYQADLYRKTIYKQDFCEEQEIIDGYPLHHSKPVENLKPFSKYGYAAKHSLYRDDFIPWTEDEQELCRGKLHVPDHKLMRTAQDQEVDSPEVSKKISDQVYNYYCPPHCIGDQKEPTPENCLVNHKDRFNLGPPTKRKNQMVEKSHHPFSKFTTYTLDYKGGKISPEEKPKLKLLDVRKATCPLSSDTSYRKAFTCPPKMDGSDKSIKRGQADTLKVGDGPMIQQTNSMLDYKDPDVSVHKPVKPPREIFRPPPCRMETTTTTGRTYKKWKDFPRLEEATKKEKSYGGFDKQHERDTRQFVTTYQEDFDGLNSALCPCRVVEKYGPKVLAPRYVYSDSEKLHDIFQFKKSSELRRKYCPH